MGQPRQPPAAAAEAWTIVSRQAAVSVRSSASLPTTGRRSRAVALVLQTTASGLREIRLQTVPVFLRWPRPMPLCDLDRVDAVSEIK
jgi:hypothetical protein